MYPCFGKLCVKEFIVESPRLEQQSGSALVPDRFIIQDFQEDFDNFDYVDVRDEKTDLTMS